MKSQKIHLGGNKYLVTETYQVGQSGGARGKGKGRKKKTEMQIHKLVKGDHEKFLTRDKYHQLLERYNLYQQSLDKTKNKAKYDKRNLERNMMDLVPPYQVNPAQRRLLQHLLGVKNVSDIEMFNTLVHAGIINTECPPLGQPHKTEAYIDPITGRKQCREPTPYRKKYTNKDCPDPKGDPFAIEKYVDWTGRTTCRRPVIRGAFSCPPPGAPHKTRSVVLADGTGICMPEENFVNSTKLFPSQVMYPDPINHKIQLYQTIFNQVNMTPRLVTRLNTLFKGSDCLKDLRTRVRKDSSLGWLEGAVKSMKSKNDIKICNAALYKFAQKNMPGYFTNRFPTATASETFLKFFGVGGQRLVTGGGRRKPKRKAKRKSKRKPKRKSKRKPKRKSKRKPKRKTKTSSSSAKSSF